MKAPESVQKKLKAQAKIAADAKVTALALKKSKRADKKAFTARGAAYAAEYAAATAHSVAQRRAARSAGGFFVPAEPKVVFVVRIRGINGVSPKAKAIMRLFRLRQLHNGVFIRVNEATNRMLKLIEPYVAYGNVSLRVVKDLILKRGAGKVQKQRIPISENAVIQQDAKLNAANIRCVDDLIHEIYTVGPNFKEANNFLWPFKLSSPNGGWSNKLLHYMEGGEAGNRGEEMTDFVKKML